MAKKAKAKTTTKRRVLSAAKLHITDEEHVALLKTRALLCSSKVRHNPKPKLLSPFNKIKPKAARIFNMSHWQDNAKCGTVGCIGGWMGTFIGDIRWDYSEQLDNLFHPPEINDWNSITKKQAVAAIDNFLATGNPNWEKAVKG